MLFLTLFVAVFLSRVAVLLTSVSGQPDDSGSCLLGEGMDPLSTHETWGCLWIWKAWDLKAQARAPKPRQAPPQAPAVPSPCLPLLDFLTLCGHICGHIC